MRTKALLIGLLCGLGCGGDDDGGGAVSTGVPPGKKLSELTAEEVMRACENLATSLDAALDVELQRFNCTLAAIAPSISVTLSGQVTGDVGKCRDLVGRCLNGEDIGQNAAQAVEPFSSSFDCQAPAAFAATSTCEATAGEYEACWNAVAANAQAGFRRLDCALVANPTEAQNAAQAQSAPMPQVCVDLDARCPQLGVPGVAAAASP